ncbi:Lipase [Tolypocladium capitatum]|uniref:Lipase n=1 Tax=Tolypocladium capitatum TaxID=45235 RepID=A0A2K3QQX7_9HYPO|nr:Lipase [Tolypocladium capitatum]
MKAGSLVALAAVAVGNPIVSVEDYVNNIDKRASISSQDFSNIKFYSQHAGAAYCNVNNKPGQPIKCGGTSGTCPDVEANKVTTVASFIGGETGLGGYVAVDNVRKEIVLGIRGSHNVRNFITDVAFAFQSCDLVDQCKVHAGFADSFKEIETAALNALKTARSANPNFKLVVTGHSLGGAVATLAAVNFRRAGLPFDAFTFGSPRVGNDHFANFVSSQPGVMVRVTHDVDPVPRLPPILVGYRHVSPEFFLANGSATQDNYSIDNVLQCPGIANTNCNGGTGGFNIDAHLHYLGPISACGHEKLNTKRDELDVSEEELEQRLNEWSLNDQEHVANIKI